VCQVLNSVIADLQKAIIESRKPQETDLSKALMQAAKDLDRAASYCTGFHLQRKRVETAIAREIKVVRKLLKSVQEIPLTADEKVKSRG
jgi:hypothetical protein